MYAIYDQYYNMLGGKGVLQYANKDIYSGEFFEDRKHGTNI